MQCAAESFNLPPILWLGSDDAESRIITALTFACISLLSAFRFGTLSCTIFTCFGSLLEAFKMLRAGNMEIGRLFQRVPIRTTFFRSGGWACVFHRSYYYGRNRQTCANGNPTGEAPEVGENIWMVAELSKTLYYDEFRFHRTHEAKSLSLRNSVSLVSWSVITSSEASTTFSDRLSFLEDLGFIGLCRPYRDSSVCHIYRVELREQLSFHNRKRFLTYQR